MNVRCLSVAILTAASLCAATVSCTPKQEATPAKAADDGVSYTLGTKAMVQTLYPDASWLPAPYADDYKDLARTITMYTQQSLARDGVDGATVTVTFPQVDGTEQVLVTIKPASAVAEVYAKVHPAFLDSAHAQAGLRAVAACRTLPSCWQSQNPTQPWAFFLPLGLPMANQKSLLFLDYPPAVALVNKDYLDNFTMCRWGRVMGAAGAANPYLFETIVDARPLAAPGSGEDARLPDPSVWFNSDTGAVYLTPMLQLLSSPAGDAGSNTRPIAIFGSSPRATWGKIVGQEKPVQVLDVGQIKLGGQARTTPWIATNHPDVTSYNCCPQDAAPHCIDNRSKPPTKSNNLIGSEQGDFVAACWLLTMAGPNPPAPETAKQQCQARWINPPSPADKQSLCVQAKLDNNNRAARCKTYEDAWNYCSANDGNACATLDCNYNPPAVKLPVPPVAKRPAFSDADCAKYLPPS